MPAESTKYPILDEIKIPQNALENWQVTADLLAEIANVPAALVMRVHASDIEVFVASHGAVYMSGEKASLDTGLYCETVLSTRKKLLVPNALKDPEWDHNPDIALSMISYCGLPLTWPTGDLFGTLCVLDNKENVFNHLVYPLMERLRDSIQLSLAQIYETSLARVQRDEAENALRESELRYERAVYGTNDGLWEWNISTGEDYLSPRWKQLLGYQDHELPNVLASFTDHIHPEDQAQVAKAIREHLDEHKPYHIELRLRCKSGEYRWFLSRGQAELDGQGRPQRMTGFISDITERKKAEATLREQLDELQRWQNVTVNREMRMRELKHEVNELLKQAGQPVRYPSAAES